MNANFQNISQTRALGRLEYINCPFCESPTFDIVYKGVNCIKDHVSNLEYYYPTATKGNLVNQVVKCRGCQFVYTNPRENHVDILGKYHDYIDNRYLSEEISRRKNAQRILNYVMEFSSPPGCWLDVGCSAGFFLDEVRKAGWEAFGLEPSKWASDFARDKLKLNVFRGEVEDLKEYPDNSFDVVSMVVVLAHVIRPVQVISEIKRVLKDKGLLFIQTPDFDSLMSKIMKNGWKTIKWQMLYFFTHYSLNQFLRKEKFKIVSHRKRGLGKQYSVDYVLAHSIEKDVQQRRINGLFNALGIGDLNIYINLYEYLNVIAEKRTDE